MNKAGENFRSVLVATSGGVDSATSAAILLKSGMRCQAVFMIMHDNAQQACEDAKKISEHLKITLHIIDVRGDFKNVTNYFCSEYRAGRTPNPCVFCNRSIKFKKLIELADALEINYIATGHYARVVSANGNSGLYASPDNSKDQSYALAMLPREILHRCIFPLGNITKPQTRQLAAKLGLHVRDKIDSQEICFIPNNDYIAKLRELCPDMAGPGNIIDGSGKVLGRHQGIHCFTVGQRRGVRVAMGRPYYVTKIDPQKNTVTLGPKDETFSRGLAACGVNWLIDRPEEIFRAITKIRYNHAGAYSTVYPKEDGNTVEIIFDEPISAITPGQAAVFYIEQPDGLQIAGAGWIERIIYRV